MEQETLVLVHNNLTYLGGTFNEEINQTYFGGEWEGRVSSAIEEYETVVSVTETKEGHDRSMDDHFIKRPEELRDRTFLPYEFGSYDKVIEDSNNGEVSREEIEDLTEDLDRLTVAGTWLNDCASTFIDQVLQYNSEVEIYVDPEYSGSWPESKGGITKEEIVRKETAEDVERRIANSPPPATENKEELNRFVRNYRDEERVKVIEEKL